MKKLTLVIFLMVLTLGFLISGTLGTATAAEKDKYGGVFKYGLSKGPAAFGYPPSIKGIDNNVGQLALEPLILVDPHKGTVLPFLATEWDISPDRKSVIFKLRKGVKFHDGTDWNAQAAKFSLDEFLKKPVLMPFLKSVDIVDDHTIRVNIDNYNSSVMVSLSMLGHAISPAAYEKNGEKWCETHPVGTGPFKFVEYSRDEFVKYKRFESYWQEGRPYLDGLELLVIKNSMTQVAALRTGKIDGLLNPTSEVAKFLRGVGYVVSGKDATVVTLAGDSMHPASVWANRKVREAIEYAIDKEALTKKLGYGFPKPAYQIVSQGHILACQDCPPRKYDPDKARKLLAEAGYPKGFKTTLQHFNRHWPESWVAIQADLKKVGIDLEVIPIDRAKYLKLREAKGGWEEGAIHIQQSGSARGLMHYMRNVISTGNRAHVTVRPAGMDDLIIKASQTEDPDTEVNLLRQVNKLIYDDVTFIPLYSENRLFVAKNNLHDCKYGAYSSDGHELFTHAWMSKK